MKMSQKAGLIGALLVNLLPYNLSANCTPIPAQGVVLKSGKFKGRKYIPPENKVSEDQGTVYFETACWTLHSNDYSTLREYLRKNKDLGSVILEAYADVRGPEDLNQQLGMSRAKSVRDIIQGLGYHGKIDLTSYGESKAGSRDETDPNTLALDRRVTIIGHSNPIQRALEVSKADIYLIDNSSSMSGNKITAVKEYPFPKKSEIYSFDSCHGLRKLESPTQARPQCGTPLWNSLYQLVNKTKSGIKITVLSDGQDTASRKSSKQVADLAKSKDVKINTIAVGVGDYTAKELKVFSESTGGNSYTIE